MSAYEVSTVGSYNLSYQVDGVSYQYNFSGRSNINDLKARVQLDCPGVQIEFCFFEAAVKNTISAENSFQFLSALRNPGGYFRIEGRGEDIPLSIQKNPSGASIVIETLPVFQIQVGVRVGRNRFTVTSTNRESIGDLQETVLKIIRTKGLFGQMVGVSRPDILGSTDSLSIAPHLNVFAEARKHLTFYFVTHSLKDFEIQPRPCSALG